MNLFGIGGFELIVIFLVGLFIVGPDKLLILIRKTKLIYTEFKKKRDELISVVEESMDIEDEGVKELKNIKESLGSISEDASTKLKQIKKDLDR
jgi:Sec-independent protein translocase protein TatA